MKTKLFLFVPVALLVYSGVPCLRSLAPLEATGDSIGQAAPPDLSPRAGLTPPTHPLAAPGGVRSDEARLPQPASVETAASAAPTPVKDVAPKSLPSAEQQSLWQAFSEARHAVDALTDHEKSLPQNNGVKYFAHNPGQRLTARFLTEGGVRLGSGRPDGEWQATLKLDTGLPALAVTASANRVEMRHAGGLTEWFENKPEGIEHGFTVERPRGATGMLEIPLVLDGLSAEADPDSPGDLRFTGEDGTSVVSYRGLLARDASGKTLAARMTATSDGGVLLAVNDLGAAYPVVIDPWIGSLEQKTGPDFTGDGASKDYFGWSVALAGDTALVGAYQDDTKAGSDAGSAYVFTRAGTAWSLQAKLTADDGSASDYFGWSVALEGDTALIGADGDHTASGSGTGSAYVFTRVGTAWTQRAQLLAADGADDDRFGCSVALSGDTALVGAFQHDTATGSDSGSAYVFTRVGAAWTQQAQLTAGDGAATGYFGWSVALAGDTALVGAAYDDTAAGSDAGSAYVFTRAGTVWTQQAKLTAGEGASNDLFGNSAALAGDTALVGAPYDDTAAGVNAGSACVFTRAGTVWTQQAKLAADDGAVSDYFGSSVALAGEFALVGAEQETDAGNAYLFVRSGTAWAQQSKLTAWDGADGDEFGYSVALSGDTALVGAYGNETAGGDTGSAYMFRLAFVLLPEITVEEPEGTKVFDGGARDFGRQMMGLPASKTFTIRNTGELDLSGLEVHEDGTHSADFTVGTLGAKTLAPGASTTFTVTFTPGAGGARSAAIHIASNDPDENPFDLSLSGSGLDPNQTVATGIDQPGIATADGGQAPWFWQTTTTHDGIDAVQSGDIGNNQSSTFSLTVSGPGTVSFWWKVSSEKNYDYLRFSIDGTEQSGKISGVVDWQQQSHTLAAGSHTLQWSFSKDGSESQGSDCGWVDQVVLPGSAPTPRQLFDAWAAAADLTDSAAEPLAMPFRDGVENLLKYAFKLDGRGPDTRVLVPGIGTAGLPRITLVRGGPQPVLRFEYLRRKGSGLAYTPLRSTGLTTWLPLAAAPLPPTDIDDEWERVVIEEPCDLAATPKLFGRVEVVLPP